MYKNGTFQVNYGKKSPRKGGGGGMRFLVVVLLEREGNYALSFPSDPYS